jgi:hypothetical protein
MMDTRETRSLQQVVLECFQSGNLIGNDGNIIDGLCEISKSLQAVAAAIRQLAEATKKGGTRK